MPGAVVTGGASGFGLALVERCADLGMDVAVLDLDGERAVAEASRVAAIGRPDTRVGRRRERCRHRGRGGGGSRSASAP